MGDDWDLYHLHSCQTEFLSAFLMFVVDDSTAMDDKAKNDIKFSSPLVT
jgi:hypothetical protein